MNKSCKKLFNLLCAITTVICIFTANNVVIEAAPAFTITTDSYVTVKNVGSNKYLNVYGSRSKNNTNITVYAKDNTNGQNFKFVKSGKGYTLIPACATSRAVNIYTSTKAKSGNNVCTWTKSGHNSQTWIPEYIEEYKAFILKSADNLNLVLTATGSANSNNVNVQTYKKGNKYQLWTSNGFSVTNNTKTTVKASNNKTVQTTQTKQIKQSTEDQLRKQITDIDTKAKKLSNKKSFKGLCGLYVYYELRARGIYSGKKSNYESAVNGNQWYKMMESSKYTKSTGGYKVSKYKGSNALDTLSNKGKKNVNNIVISYEHGYSKESYKYGHVVYIHAIYNGKVYFSESYDSTYAKAGNPTVMDYSKFKQKYKDNYGKILGCVVFTK